MLLFKFIFDCLKLILLNELIYELILIVTILHVFYDLLEWVGNRY